MLFFPYLPECHSTGGSYIKGIYSVGHGYLHGAVGSGYRFITETFAFSPKDDSKALSLLEEGFLDTYSVLAERKSGGHKAELFQLFHIAIVGGEICPGHLKNRTHAHSRRASVQGVTA